MKKSPVKSRPFAKHGNNRTPANCSRMLVMLTLLLPMLLPSAFVQGQPGDATQPLHRVGSRHKPQSLDERIELLARYLDLNEGQRSALKSILLERQTEILQMRHAPYQGEGLQMDRFRAIEDKTVERIRAMLTEEQRKKYDPLGARTSTSAAQNVSVEDWLKKTGPR